MSETDASSCSSIVRFYLWLTRYFYVKSAIIIVCILLICTSWAEFIKFNPVGYYCTSLIGCLILTFVKKGFCEKRSMNARREAYLREINEEKQLRRLQQRAIQQALQEEKRAALQELRAAKEARQEQICARFDERRQAGLHGEQRPTAAGVEIHVSNVPGNISSQSESESQKVPLPQGEPSTSAPKLTMPSVVGNPFSPSSPDLSIQSSRSSDLTSQGTRSDNLTQSSADQSSQSTSSASAREDRRFDESQQAMLSDSDRNVSQ